MGGPGSDPSFMCWGGVNGLFICILNMEKHIHFYLMFTWSCPPSSTLQIDGVWQNLCLKSCKLPSALYMSKYLFMFLQNVLSIESNEDWVFCFSRSCFLKFLFSQIWCIAICTIVVNIFFSASVVSGGKIFSANLKHWIFFPSKISLNFGLISLHILYASSHSIGLS